MRAQGDWGRGFLIPARGGPASLLSLCLRAPCVRRKQALCSTFLPLLLPPSPPHPSLLPSPLPPSRALLPAHRLKNLLVCSYTTNVTHVPGKMRTALVAMPL